MDRIVLAPEIDHADAARPEAAPTRRGDVRLIRSARGGSADAREEIVRRYWSEAERTATLIVHDPHAAQDIAQESLLLLLDSLGRFDERRRLGPWLNRIAVNRSIDWLRKRGDVAGRPDDQVAAPPPSVTDPDLLDALHRLAVPDRVAIVMRAVLGYRAVEIAATLGEPAGTTRSRIHRALQQLRNELAEREETN